MPHSQAWREFIGNMRETAQLLRADPSSVFMARAVQQRSHFARWDTMFTTALTKACVMMTSGRLQGCIESQTQEFLEHIDVSGIVADRIPETLRAALCARYFKRKQALNFEQTAEVHRAYASFWIEGTPLQTGTLRTDSLPDNVWNPRPERVQTLMKRCDIDLNMYVERAYGTRYLGDMQQYVDELIAFRNDVAHGSEPPAWTRADVRLRMRWATRLARNCDRALDEKLVEIVGQGW